MNYRKLIDSSLFELSFVEDPTDEFLAFKTFNDDKLFQIIDVNFSITELVFGDKRLFTLFAEKFMIRFLDPKEDVFFLNLRYREKTFFFKVSGMSGLANIVLAIAYAYDFLVRTKTTSDTVYFNQTLLRYAPIQLIMLLCSWMMITMVKKKIKPKPKNTK